MKQELTTLGGKPLAIPGQEPQRVRTHGDELRIGVQLLSDIGGHIDRDEQVPEDLSAALREWQENAGVLAHSPDPEVRRTYGGMWTAIERDLIQRVDDADARRLMREQVGDKAFFKTWKTPERGPAPMPPLPKELEVAAFQVDPATRRTASIMRAPIEMTPEGHAVVVDSEGEVWDLTEALAEWNRPEVREQLRQSMMGVIPGDPAVANTLGAMPMMQLAAEGMRAAYGRGDVRNIETASAGLTLPWIVGLGPDGGIRGDEEELLKDPVWARALEETMWSIDPTATGFETFGHALAGGLDFAIFSIGAGLAAKGAGAAASATLPKGPATIVNLLTKAISPKPGSVWPLNSDILRTTLSFGAYESIARATDDSTTMTEDYWHGLQQGAIFSFAGKAAKGARALGTEVAYRGPVKTAMERLAPLISRAGPVGKGGDAEVVFEQIRRFGAPTFSKTIEKLALAPYAKQTIQHAFDAYWMGVLVHSYQNAQAAPPEDQFREFWHGIVDSKSHATGLAFALSGALQYPLGVRQQINSQLTTPEGQAFVRRMARAYSSPTAETHLRQIKESFDRWKEREPDVFDGIEFVPPAEQEAIEKAGLAEMEARDRPKDTEPAFREMKIDDAEAGKPEAHELGEITLERLKILGFKNHKHALNAVREYLRVIEGDVDTTFKHFRDVPRALWERALDWRDRGKPPRGQETLREPTEEELRAELDRQMAEPLPPEAAPSEPARQPTATRRLPDPPKENYLTPLTAYTDRLYRETSIERVFEMIDPGTTSPASEFYWSNSKDLAIGQGSNRGVMLEVEAFPELEGQINKKPAWELAWAAGTAEFVTRYTLGKQIRPHVLSVTVQPDAAGPKWATTRLRGVLRSWSKTKNADGSVTYRPPGREVEREVPAAAPGKPANPGSVGEAADIHREVEAEPSYEGMAPIEKAAVAKDRKRKGRPSLGSALRDVIEGRKPREWLAEKFPEGAAEIGRGDPAQWVGKFERAVRDVWKQRRKRALEKARRNVGKLPPERRLEAQDVTEMLERDPDALGPVELTEPRQERRRLQLELGPEDIAAEESMRDVASRLRRAVAGEVEPELVREAEQDPLTGFLNARAFEAVAQRIIKAQRRRPGTKSIAIFVDLADLTSLNNLFGHDFANEVIRDYASGWRELARAGDARPARTGGDEFGAVLIMPQEADPTALIGRIEGVAQSALGRHGLEGGVVGRTFGADAGWAEIRPDIADPLEALKEAHGRADEMATARKQARAPGKRKLSAEQYRRLAPAAQAERHMRVHGPPEAAGNASKLHGPALEQFRGAIEAGVVPLPDGEAGRRKFLGDVFAGAPRYRGMDSAAIEREVLALRKQAELGDPGLMMAGPPETAVTHAKRASAGMRRIVEELKALEELDVETQPGSTDAMDAVNRVLYGERPEKVPEDTWARLVAEASDVQESTRDALRMTMRDTWEEGQIAGLEALWLTLDARASGADAPPEAVALLKKYGWADESGAINTAYLDRLQQEAATHIARLTELDDPGFASGVVPTAFFSRKFTDVTENRWGRMISWAHWLEKPAVQRALGRPWARKVFKAFTTAIGNPIVPVLNLGPISRPQSARVRKIMEQSLLRFGVRRGDAEQMRVVASFLGSQFSRQYGGMRAPQGDHDFFLRGMEGAFAKAKGPEDLERMRPGSGYMWPIYTGVRDLFEESGMHMNRLGLLTSEQLDALGGGKYLSHYYIREQLEGEAQELAGGRLPVKYQGRSMPRDGIPNPADPVMRVPDAPYAVTRGIFDESQSIRVFGTLRDVMDRYGEWALSAEQVADLGAFDRADFQRAGVRTVPLEGESLIDAVFREARRGVHPKEALLLGARLQLILDQMAEPGEAPRKGQTPYSSEKENLVKFYLGESGRGPVFIPKPLAQELEITMSEIFTLPGENISGKWQTLVDKAMLFRKRGFTALRPSNWVLNFISSAERNAVLGGVPRNDFIRGMVGLPSFTSDGIAGLGHVMRWIKEGAPQDRPAGWTQQEWIDLRQAQSFMKIAGTSTSMVQTMGQDFVSEFGASAVAPDVTRGAWMRELERQGEANGWSLDQRDRMALAIEEKTSRMFSGLESLDGRILKWLGEPDPGSKAKALAAYTTAWNLTDLFFFKYPAYLKAKHEWPDVTQSKVLAYALGKTGNMADTHPWLRTHLSMHGPWGDALWRASRGTMKLGPAEVSRATAQLALSWVFRHRFWMDTTTMVPAALRASVTHPWRMAGSLAIGGGAAALAMAAMNDDEKRLWDEEAATARRAVTRWPSLTAADEEAFKRIGAKIGRPGNMDLRLPESAVDAMAKFWGQLKQPDPFAVPMPKHGGESRVGSLAELVPPGQVHSMLRGYQKLAGGVLGAGESRERAQEALQGVERLFGMTAQIGASLALGAVGGDSPLLDGLGGRGSTSEALAKLFFSVAGAGGVMYPTLGLFTPEGQFMGEAVLAGGQKWNEALRGIGRAYNPQDAGENALGVGLRYAWPSRSIYQRAPLASPVDGWTALLSEMYGEGFSPSTADGRAKMRAHRWVTAQMSTMIADLYEQHFDEAGDLGAVDWTLDDRIRGAFDEFWQHTQVVNGMGAIEPGYEPKGFLLQQIAAQPERGDIIPHLRAWASRDRFQEDGMTMLLEAGRKREMPKGLFREGFRNALEDPVGGNLIKWWWSQVERGDDATLGALAPLMWDTQIPSENTEAFRAYQKLMDRYIKAGFTWPPTAPGARSVEDILGELGHSRTLQGAPAFRGAVLQRPNRPSALEELFK